MPLLATHCASTSPKIPTRTLAEFRDRIGSGRQQTQALLEHFDALKYTMRRGDELVAWQLPKNSETRDE